MVRRFFSRAKNFRITRAFASSSDGAPHFSLAWRKHSRFFRQFLLLPVLAVAVICRHRRAGVFGLRKRTVSALALNVWKVRVDLFWFWRGHVAPPSNQSILGHLGSLETVRRSWASRRERRGRHERQEEAAYLAQAPCRWEWRMFAPSLANLESKIGTAVNVPASESTEIYLLGGEMT
jgi:hypothetical protein